MMIIPVSAKNKQAFSDITFAGGTSVKDHAAKDFHLDITAIDCDMPKCKPRPKCQSVLSQSCQCGDGHIAPEPEPKRWILRYNAVGKEHCTLRFDWCELLWSLPPKLYNVTLYRDCHPCGRFRIQLRNDIVFGADVTPTEGC